MKHKVGDTVRVRSWESMEKEHGVDANGDIYMPARMCVGMKEFCGLAFKITDIHDDWYRSNHFSTFWFYADMLEPEFMVKDITIMADHVEKDAGTAPEMTKALKGGLEERVARIIFLNFMPSHMVHEDWDSGSMLGRNNAFRHKIEMVAKLVVTEINR